MTINPTNLLRAYKAGCSFRKNDALVPRAGAKPITFDVIESKVVVLEQSCFAPHQYTVIGEALNPRSPADRFMKFEINGHEWEKIGHASAATQTLLRFVRFVLNCIFLRTPPRE